MPRAAVTSASSKGSCAGQWEGLTLGLLGRICLTERGCGEGEGGWGDGGGGAAGVDPPLNGAVGPAAGRDAATRAVRRVVDDVPWVEALSVIGADTGCGNREARPVRGWVQAETPGSQPQGLPAAHPQLRSCTPHRARCKGWRQGRRAGWCMGVAVCLPRASHAAKSGQGAAPTEVEFPGHCTAPPDWGTGRPAPPGPQQLSLQGQPKVPPLWGPSSQGPGEAGARVGPLRPRGNFNGRPSRGDPGAPSRPSFPLPPPEPLEPAPQRLCWFSAQRSLTPSPASGTQDMGVLAPEKLMSQSPGPGWDPQLQLQ